MIRGRWLPLLALALALCSPALADTAQLHNTAGLAFYYQGNLKTAYDEFVRALELDPNAPDPHFNLGRIFEKQARYKEALDQYRQTLSLRPDHSGAQEGVGRMGYYVTPQPVTPAFSEDKSRKESISRELKEIHSLRVRGRLDQAIARADEALGQFPDEPRFELAAAAALEAKGELNGALGRLMKAERFLPGSIDLQLHLARNFFKVGLLDEALRHGERCVELDPKDARSYLVLADIYKARNEPSLSFDRMFEAARLNPGDEALAARVREASQLLGLGHYTAGVFYFNSQNWKVARDELRMALESGKLSDEQRAIAQQYLIVSDFSLAKVADSIRQLQKDRAAVEHGFLNKRIGFNELVQSPNAFAPGTFVSFEGWIVSAAGSPPNELVVTTDPGDVEGQRSRFGRAGISSDNIDFNIGIGRVAGGIDRGVNARNPSGGTGRPGQVTSPTRTSLPALDSLGRGPSQPTDELDFRSNSNMERWFTARTPRPLPTDSRIRPRSRVTVEGKLAQPAYIKNSHNGLFSRKPQPVVEVTFVSIQRESRSSPEQRSLRLPDTDLNTPPGLAGPLRVDFLQLDDLQRRNR